MNDEPRIFYELGEARKENPKETLWDNDLWEISHSHGTENFVNHETKLLKKFSVQEAKDKIHQINPINEYGKGFIVDVSIVGDGEIVKDIHIGHEWSNVYFTIYT